jgi:hypothetical protein
VVSAGCGFPGSLKVGHLVGQYFSSGFHEWVHGWPMEYGSHPFEFSEGCLDVIESLVAGLIAGLAVGHSFAYLFDEIGQELAHGISSCPWM